MNRFFLLSFLIFNNLFGQIFVNQLGYKTDLTKYFYTNINASTFEVVNEQTGNVVFNGQLNLISTNDPATGMLIKKGDFSPLTNEGNYFIRINSDTSFHFKISNNAFVELLNKSLKAFYFQRCGSQLFYTHAGVYQRQVCHSADAFFHFSTGQSGYKLSRGGWHDAGDYGKYVVNAGISAATLLMAYELFPEYFSSDSLNIPESGNGIPDILDEVKYEINWLLTMQDSNGAVFHKLTKTNFESFVMPSQDSGMRYIYQKSSTATGNFIAVLSRFYRVYRQFDSSFANQCLNAAKNAWNWLINQPTIVPAGGFKNPSDTQTGEYGDANDSDERLWASAELFEATGDVNYKDYYDFNYNLGGLINSTMNWQNVRTLAHLTYLFSNQLNADAAIKLQLHNSLISYCNTLNNKRHSNGFGVTLNPGEYYWGSNSIALNNAILLILAFRRTNNNQFLSCALEQLNYVLGSNAHNISFVTGIGKKYPMKPHHRPSEADGIVEPIPGLIVGGPEQYRSDPVLQQYFTPNTPPALCYIDHLQSYASNEIAINWNAPLVFVAGFFKNFFLSEVEYSRKQTPADFTLEQNFPNPFNGETKIRYKLLSQNQNNLYRVKLSIINLLGEEVAILFDGIQQDGNYEIIFNPSVFNSAFATGVYFYKLTVNEKFDFKKMVYLK